MGLFRRKKEQQPSWGSSSPEGDVLVDLSGAALLTADDLRGENYLSIPHAVRNGLVAIETARGAQASIEEVADLLGVMMGRTPIATQLMVDRATAISAATAPEWTDRSRVSAIASGELRIAARSSLPTSDRARAQLRARLGHPVDEAYMGRAIVETRLTLLGSMPVAQLIVQAVNGDRDLAFVVGVLRTVGEQHAAEVAGLA